MSFSSVYLQIPILSRLPPNPHFFPRKCFSFISQEADPSLAQNFRVFNALDSERKPCYAATKGCYAAAYPRLLDSSLIGSLQGKTSTMLRRTTPQCGVLRRCIPEATTSLLILFSASGHFFYYLASFFILISPCPVKHYNMED